MKMTDKQIHTYLGEAINYADRDAYASDVCIAVYDAAEDNRDIDPDFIEQVRHLWDVACVPFRDLIKAIGMSQTAVSNRFCIPLKTVSNWAASPDSKEHRECPIYTKLMIAELTGYIALR